MIKASVTGLFCFALFLLLHVAVFRAFRPQERFRAITLIFYILIPVYCALYYLVPVTYTVVEVLGPPLRPLIPVEIGYRVTVGLNFSAGLMLYVFLFLGYCQFYFIVDRSISVRVMIELEKAGGEMTGEDLRRVYPLEGVLERRLEHMVSKGYITENGGRIKNTAKGKAEARLFAFMKELLGIGPGG